MLSFMRADEAACQHLVANRILLAEDDADDHLMISDALRDCCPAAGLHWVRDGVELMDYLTHRNKYSDICASPTPTFLLMDMNMPKMSGLEALREIKSRAEFGYLPIICMSQTAHSSEVQICYRAGAASYIRKPDTFTDVGALMKSLHDYWFKTAIIPPF
jgi:CheY-like chemotaxis protein